MENSIDIFLIIVLVLIIPIANAIFLYSKYKQYKSSQYYQTTNNSFWSVFSDSGMQGEYKVAKQLQNFSLLPNYKILFNLYIPKENGETTEIDLILITPYGLFVIESKNYSGWIFGNTNNKFWTQTLSAGRWGVNKEHFYNPIKQNANHILHLKNLLKIDIPYWSIIAFSDDCEFKKVNYDNAKVMVIHQFELYNTIQSILDNCQHKQLTDEAVEKLYNYLQKYMNVDFEVKRTHIENIIKNKY